jgi:hypothetical protein
MTSANDPQRQPRFQRNADLDALLQEINSRLELTEQDLPARYSKPAHPVVLVIGAPRSGTTLLMQWLATTGLVAYPTNLLSRFYAAPYIGALICRMIGDPQYDYGGELRNPGPPSSSFKSELGKTQGLFEPNGYWFFWRRFIPNNQSERLSEDDLSRVDSAGFLAGIAALQAVFDKAWAMKGTMLQYNLVFLQSFFDRFLFVRMRRELDDNARSLLNAREQFFGNANEWYSVRPPGYQRLLEKTPLEQVTGQVQYTNASIDEEFRVIPAAHQLDIDYEQFCLQPRARYDEIVAKLQGLGYARIPSYQGPEAFTVRTRSPANHPVR